MMENTETSPARTSWRGRDSEVIRLRQWGSDNVYPLPAPHEKKHHPLNAWTVGAGEESDLRILDPTRRTSRRHASLVREERGWSIFDIGSKNGLRVDGVPQAASHIHAGQEIQIGGVTLIAESVRLMVMRDFLSRILGMNAGNSEQVDVALRALRTATVRRLPLLLRGTGDLVPLAVQLHRKMPGQGRPFVLCDPKRTSTDADARRVPNELSIEDAIAAATGGTLCLREKRLPPRFSRAVSHLRKSPPPFFLLICSEKVRPDLEELYEPSVINVPPLSTRTHEVEQVVHAYLAEASQTLGVRLPFDEKRIEWITAHSAHDFGEIEKAALRLTALAASASLLEAAALLGVAEVSLKRWMKRRGLTRIATTSPENADSPTR